MKEQEQQILEKWEFKEVSNKIYTPQDTIRFLPKMNSENPDPSLLVA